MGIVKGFTDIIAPQNLATNGSFRINQRGLFTSGLVDAKLGDYVSDAWKINPLSNSPDFFQVYNNTTNGTLRIRGYGKCNQQLSIINSSLTTADLKGEMTLTLTAALGAGSVPVRIDGYPTALANNINTTQLNLSSISPSGRYTTTTSFQSGSNGYIRFLLRADGEFDVTFSNVGIFSGQYVNPPAYAPIPLADDLLRCKRYYQTGKILNSAIAGNSTTTNTLGLIAMLPVEMAGTPTLSTTYFASAEEGESSPVQNHAGHSYTITPIGATAVYARVSKPISGSSINYFDCNFTATI